MISVLGVYEGTRVMFSDIQNYYHENTYIRQCMTRSTVAFNSQWTEVTYCITYEGLPSHFTDSEKDGICYSLEMLSALDVLVHLVIKLSLMLYSKAYEYNCSTGPRLLNTNIPG